MLAARQINDTCNACNVGHLRPDFHSVQVGTSSSGVIGLPIHEEQILHLGCDNCGLLYKAADVGLTIQQLIEQRGKDFQNPKKEPAACTQPNCGSTTLLRLARMEPLRRGISPPGDRRQYEEMIVACERCFTTLYIHPSPAAQYLAKEMEELKARLKKKGMRRRNSVEDWGPSRITPGSRQRRSR